MLKPEQFYYDVLAQSEIPEGMHDGIVLYLLHGLPPGNFLSAVLSNDLAEAVNRADEQNAKALAAYVKFIYQHFPINAWGTAQHVSDWMNYRRAAKVVA